MAYCKYCKIETSEKAVYCGVCGAIIVRKESSAKTKKVNLFEEFIKMQQAAQSRQGLPYYVQDGRPDPFKGINPAVSFGRSPLFLIAVVAFAACLVLSFVNSLLVAFAALDSFFQSADGFVKSETMIAGMERAVVAVLVLIYVPNALILSGMPLFYWNSLKKNTVAKPLRIVKVGAKLYILLIYVIFGLTLLPLTLLGFMTVKFYVPFLGVLLVFPLIYFYQIIETVNRINATLDFTVPWKFSYYVMIVNWLIVGFNIILAVQSTLRLDITAVAASISSVIFFLTFTVQMHLYNHKCKFITISGSSLRFIPLQKSEKCEISSEERL